ncbi:hypothetical protein [Dyadobacter bucti]|uniref:hypothetical protein n=1 Tax=Dyadobacter bucti TaxID=2572203 RepID=UPI003F6F4609
MRKPVLVSLTLSLFIVGILLSIRGAYPALEIFKKMMSGKGGGLHPAGEADFSGSGMPPCKGGPELLAISGISSNALTAVFFGEDVYEISWKIMDSASKIIRSGDIKPTANELGISFDALPVGRYILAFKGKSCASAESKKTFAISENIVSSPGARSAGSGRKIITQGFPDHMDISVSGRPGDWVIDDFAQPFLEKGYEFRYMVNAHLFTQNVPLTNYRFQSDGPLRIWKMKTKIGLESVNKWSDRENNYYYSTTAGVPFSYNSSAAIHTSVLGNAQAGPRTSFAQIVPQEYNPRYQGTQWADFAPDMKLPAGNFWVASLGEWSIDLLRRKGVTHFSHFQLPWKNPGEVARLKDAGQTYNDVPRIEHFMHLSEQGPDKWQDGYNLKYWPNGPLNENEAIKKANEADISDAIWITETLEGNSTMPQDKDMWRHFYRRLRERYEERFGKRNIPYLICHNYFQFWPGSVSLSSGRQASKNLMRLPLSELPTKNFTPGGTLQSTNLIMEAVYLNAPDIQNEAVYQSLFRMELIKKMGYKAGVFLFGVHEWFPNNFYQYNYEDGKYFNRDKIPLDPNTIIAYAFLSQIYGNLYVEWGGSGKNSGRDFDLQWSSGLWYPNAASKPQEGFPHYLKPGGKHYNGYTGSPDLSYFGIKLFNNTFGKVHGGQKEYLKFRIDGGKWLQPSQDLADEIVDAFHDQRGFVLSQTKDSKTAWFYINSFADNLEHRIEVELPDGRIVEDIVAANGIHAALVGDGN